MANRKKSNFSFTKVLVMTILVAVSGYLLFSVAKEVMTTVQLTKELKEVNIELEKIKTESENLKERKEKLKDPEYIKSYARGEYSLTKEGEQIFHLPSSKDKVDKEENKEDVQEEKESKDNE